MTERRAFALLEVIIAGVVLAIGLGAVVSLASRSLMEQQRGERGVVAAALLDQLLAEILVEGPVDWPKQHDTSGTFESPFDGYNYEVVIEEAEPGYPCEVMAIVHDDAGRGYRCATRIAIRAGEEPNPERMPSEPFDRQSYWDSKDDENAATK